MSHAMNERRDFERVKEALDVTYRLLSVSEVQVPEQHLNGVTRDINARGILLSGTLPSLSLVVPLLTQKVLLSLEIALPRPQTRLKALAAVRWVEAVDAEKNECAMGLFFNEISAQDRRRLFEFLVWQRTGCGNA
jgi:c-di-GMP-binding flagellar brake protein YcgR